MRDALSNWDAAAAEKRSARAATNDRTPREEVEGKFHNPNPNRRQSAGECGARTRPWRCRAAGHGNGRRGCGSSGSGPDGALNVLKTCNDRRCVLRRCRATTADCAACCGPCRADTTLVGGGRREKRFCILYLTLDSRFGARKRLASPQRARQTPRGGAPRAPCPVLPCGPLALLLGGPTTSAARRSGSGEISKGTKS